MPWTVVCLLWCGNPLTQISYSLPHPAVQSHILQQDEKFLEISVSLLYNTNKSIKKKRAVKKMSAVKVKPIQATKISDISIITAIIKEALTEPSPEAVAKNKEASELLNQLQRKG